MHCMHCIPNWPLLSLGNQLRSSSSVEAYAELLHAGFRCLELDCWDGDNGEPIITHGNTFCTRVMFRDVVKCIADNAFSSGNPWPVILSLEVHCSLAQQARMAEVFRQELGDLLLTEPVTDANESNELPSPLQLQNKILLKGKTMSGSKDPNGPDVKEVQLKHNYCVTRERISAYNSVTVGLIIV